MNIEPSRDIKWYGTDETVTPLTLLKAGPIEAELDTGNLRHIRFNGTEIIRAVSFIVRDHNWGTYNPEISHLTIDQTSDGFSVTYEALAHDDRQSLRYHAQIKGHADGRLDFSATAEPETEFLTNRTGFVVLHPCNLAGRKVRVEHTDGHIEERQFPTAIDPLQPLLDLRCLTHETASGHTVSCRLEGEVYEMEDQRNWTDASYKTYTRPLALPWPYRLPAEEFHQAVKLRISGASARPTQAKPGATLHVGQALGTIPPLGLGLQAADAASAREHASILKQTHVAHLIGYFDPREGHDKTTLQALCETAAALNAEPWLEAVITSVDRFQDELAALGRMVTSLGSPFPTVLVSPAADLKCTLPGSPWPPAPPAREFFTAARKAFPGVRLGGGMFSLFTELNRKRPPTDLIDLVSFTTTATLHAGDDISIMETTESLPVMALTAAQISKGKPWSVGPSAIGMRMNPYGEAPFANPGNIRRAMNFNDPRHRGLLGASWALGFFAQFAKGGASAIALGGATGPFGLLHTPEHWPQPGYDEAGGGLFPMYHVIRGLGTLRGLALHAVESSIPSTLQAIAATEGQKTIIWVANLSAREARCTLDAEITTCAILDEQSFVAASNDVDAINTLARPAQGRQVDLAPYAVARLILS